MVKGSFLQEGITILNIWACNLSVSKYMRQKLIKLKGEKDQFSIIFVDFNTPLSVIDRSRRQKLISLQLT